MKTGELAARFKLDPKTVKAWTDEFEEFFSKDAQGIGRTQRFYHPDDQIILNTILSARSERRKPEEIRAMLAGGERNSNLPAEFAIMRREDTVTVLMEVRLLQLQIDNLNTEIARLETEKEEIQNSYQVREAQLLQEAKEREEKLIQEARVREEKLADSIKELNKEVKELYGDVGAWRARYDMLKERLEKDDK
jgi:DNA-binding transcriptional MerR regulator